MRPHFSELSINVGQLIALSCYATLQEYQQIKLDSHRKKQTIKRFIFSECFSRVLREDEKAAPLP